MVGESDGGDIVMLVKILRCWWQNKDAGDIFLHVGNMSIGHQHSYISECDVSDRLMYVGAYFFVNDYTPTLVAF